MNNVRALTETSVDDDVGQDTSARSLRISGTSNVTRGTCAEASVRVTAETSHTVLCTSVNKALNKQEQPSNCCQETMQ